MHCAAISTTASPSSPSTCRPCASGRGFCRSCWRPCSQGLANGRKLRLSAEALAALQAYDFPGNIRELRNIVERAVLLTDGEVIRPEALPADLTPRPQGAAADAEEAILPLDQVEHRYVRWALERVNGDKKRLARLLGISERTLYRKLEA